MTMKWVARFKDRVTSPFVPPVLEQPEFDEDGNVKARVETEQDFKRYWDVFRSSNSEKDKEEALEMAVNVFCKLSRKNGKAPQLASTLVDARLFSFVVARALFTDIDNLRRASPNYALQLDDILAYFSVGQKQESVVGLNLLFTLEGLVSPPLDVEPLLDAGLLSCLVSILYRLLGSSSAANRPTPSKQGVWPDEDDKALGKRQPEKTQRGVDPNVELNGRLVVEGGVVHIMKALAQHPGAAQRLADDDSLQLLFHIIKLGSISSGPGMTESESNPLLHRAQLHRHSLQILELLLVSDNGSTAKYVRDHQLIEILCKALTDFDCESGDPAYTLGVASLLLDCLQLSSSPAAGGIRLREDLKRAQGYQSFVQLALKFLELSLKLRSDHSPVSTSRGKRSGMATENASQMVLGSGGESLDTSTSGLAPYVMRFLDFVVELSQVGEYESASGSKEGKASGVTKPAVPSARCFPLFDGSVTGSFEIRGREMDGKLQDLDALQVLQELFLQSGNCELQLEVLDRLLRLFSSHPDNYSLVQELRTIPFFVQNMATFPAVIQERLLKILEYVVTVVNRIPEQELWSLCYLLQQPLHSAMRTKVLSFFMKLLSFDRQYKKVFGDVGLLQLLIDDLKLCEPSAVDSNKHQFLSESTRRYEDGLVGLSTLRSSALSVVEQKVSSPSAVLVDGEGFVNLHVFGDAITTVGAWKCLHSLLERCEGNQAVFRTLGGISVILPLLVAHEHRSGVLRVLTCLICEDTSQIHAEELGGLLRILKAGVVSTISGKQLDVGTEVITDVLWAVCRILTVNTATRIVFGETKGFTLLITVLKSLQLVENLRLGTSDESQLYAGMASHDAWEVVDALLHVVTAGASNSLINRNQLHETLTCQPFKDLLTRSCILCHEYEERLVNAFFDVALQRVERLSRTLDRLESLPVMTTGENDGVFGKVHLDKDMEEICNPGAVEVLIYSLLHFSTALQLKTLNRVEKLARVGARNQDALTAFGCVGLLLEAMQAMLGSQSYLVISVLRIIEVLGVYRLSSSEFRTLGNYVWQSREASSSFISKQILEVLERMTRVGGVSSESISLSPFAEFNMVRTGHASMHVSLGERVWPPAVGYSFACWVRYRNHMRRASAGNLGLMSRFSEKKPSSSESKFLHLLTVATADDKSTACAELYMNELGVLTLATSPTAYLSFKEVKLEEGQWYNLVVVHSKPNALAGLFQSSIASLYVNGSLRETGKLGYTASPAGKSLHIRFGTPASVAEVLPLSWRLGPCYLFEEVLLAPAIFFLYCLGRGYRGIFQDSDLLRFVPPEACGGENLAILEALETELTPNSNIPKGDTGRSPVKLGGSGIFWDLDRLAGSWTQLSSKKLIFAFDGTHPKASVTSSVTSMYNLVDPMAAAASPNGGLPRFARLHGDVYICTPRSMGDNVHTVGGVAVVLALVEASKSRDILRAALSLLVNVLYANPRNLQDMLSCRGYHLLALFLHRRMEFFEIQDLDLLFKIAACKALPFLSSRSADHLRTTLDSGSLGLVQPDLEMVGYNISLDADDQALSSGLLEQSNFNAVVRTRSQKWALEGRSDRASEISVVLSNPEMMEHVLLDWTLWVTAPVSIQLALLNFVDRLVSMHHYRVHNLTILRRVNIVQHLLITLQRGDVEVPVLEKLVVLLGILLEDGFLPAELKYVADFVVMTFDPPDPVSGMLNVAREEMSIQVIVRNMFLEMLIDLQMTISGDEILESWHKIVSSKLITFLLDEAVHATSMRWVVTLLGVCLSSSPMFSAKFRGSGGYQALVHVLPSFYDSPEVYYVLFCLLFGHSVYPRIPEVRMLDFHALMPNDGGIEELNFTDLLESIVAMTKAVFDHMSMISQKAQESGDFTQFNLLLAAWFSETSQGTGETLQGEALLHKTHAARLMSGDAAAPGFATCLLRFMVDLAKMCHPFSIACQRQDFLECSVDLYFSCARAAAAVQEAQIVSAQEQGLPEEVQEVEVGFSDITPPLKFNGVDSDAPGPSQKAEKENGSMNAFSAVEQQVNMSSGKSLYTYEKRHPSTPESETRGINSPITLARNESLASYESANAMTKLPGQESQDAKSLSSPVDQMHLLVGGSTPSDVSAQVRRTSSAASSTTGTGEYVFLTGSQIHRASSVASSTLDTSLSGINLESEIYFYSVRASLLVQLEVDGTVGGPCSSGASAVLDLLAEIFAEVLSKQPKGAFFMETALEAVPLNIDSGGLLVFQGLCLSRVMSFFERRLVRDDETEKKLDRSRWGPNLEMLSTLLVDRVYAEAFIHPGGTLKVLEFLLAMLQMANKDGQVEDITPAGRGLLSLTRGGFRQVEPFVQALLRSTNRMFMYSFIPLTVTGMNAAIRHSQDALEGTRGDLGLGSMDLDSHTSLRLILAHKKLLLCPSNIDTEFLACLCVHTGPMLWDAQQQVRGLSLELWKALLVYRGPALEELLVCKDAQGQVLDVMHGGFEKITTSVRDFLLWIEGAQDTITRTLELRATHIWLESVAAATRLSGSKVKALEARRRKEMGRKMKEISKAKSRHWEQMIERRVALDVVREAMAAELRVMCQDKYGWVLHAESEWSSHFQGLVHERGIWPMARKTVDGDPLWQLCATEGPYRMRKKLERCKFQLDLLTDVALPGCYPEELAHEDLTDQNVDLPDSNSEHGALVLENDHFSGVDKGQSDSAYHVEFEDEDFEGAEEDRDLSLHVQWSKGHIINVLGDDEVPPLSSNGNKSAVSVDGSSPSEYHGGDSSLPMNYPSTDDILRSEEKKLDKVVNDDGEYLVRPHLQPGEKIRFRYNCERVIGLDKHDGIFLIGELSLYVIEHYFIDEEGRISEKEWEGELSVIDRALGVKTNTAGGASMQDHEGQIAGMMAGTLSTDTWLGGRAWARSGGNWGKETVKAGKHMTHAWRMWKLESVHELLKRRYQLRPVAVEIFSMDGCNELLVFHKGERDEVFKNLHAMNLPRNSLLHTTISGVSKQEGSEGGRLFKIMAKSFSKRWQNGEISNFQYLMHLNTLAGRGYNDLTQYPVFPWILSDYESDDLDLSNPATFRALDKPMGALSRDREEEFIKRFESWEDPEIPRFHYGSHYSSAGSVLFYLLRLPPFSIENQHLQGGQFDHADRLFNSLRDTWLSASHGNTADVKELIPEFFYLPEFLENRFDFDFGVKQSGEKVHDVLLPPWAKGSAREFVRKHREALESQYVSENLHHWIDLIFGFRQRGKPAVDATNVFFHLTYEGAVDIDSIPDPPMKASILAQINHFGQTPRQLFLKPHPKRKWQPQTSLIQNLCQYHLLDAKLLRTIDSAVSQIVMFHDRIFVAGGSQILKPPSYSKYLSWGYKDRSLRFISYDQDKILSTHEGLHDCGPVRCAGMSRDGKMLVTGGEDGVVAVWRQRKDGVRGSRRLHLLKALCGHTKLVTCLSVCQPYNLVVSGSLDRSVIFWDLTSLEFVRQLPELPAPASAVYANDMTGEVVTAAGTTLYVWSINGDCLAAVNTSHIASDAVLSIASPHLSDWMEVGWYITGHQNGSIKLWCMKNCHWGNGEDNHSLLVQKRGRADWSLTSSLIQGKFQKRKYTGGMSPEYQLIQYRLLSWHNEPVTAICTSNDLKQLYSGDGAGNVVAWTLSEEGQKQAAVDSCLLDACSSCVKPIEGDHDMGYCCNCGQLSCRNCLSNRIVLGVLGYFKPVPVCIDCFDRHKS